MRPTIPIVLAALVLATVAIPAQSTTEVSDTLSVVKGDQALTNAQITAAIADVTPSLGDAVMIAREDNFADALASGLLQRNGPLFAVPSDGPISEEVLAQIQRATPDRAIVLGGTAAVGQAVVDQLRGLSLEVERLAGGTRFDTAIAIAESEAPTADTVMLARAFPSDGAADPTQAFADTLAAGGVSARNGWPVLLTQTDQLTAPTADYLRRSGASRVMVLGGTAAISQAVFDEAVSIVGSGMRVSGPTRFETAVELEKVAGAQSAADVTQVILIEGTGTNAFGPRAGFAQGGVSGPDAWAAGFASAHRAFVFNAPILLTASGEAPQPTADFLAGGVGGDPATAPLITCTMTGPACEEGRVAAGLPAAVNVEISPPEGDLEPGTGLVVTLPDYAGPATVSGTCLAVSASTTDGSDIIVTAADALPESSCDIVVSGIVLSDATTQTETFTFVPVAATGAPRRAVTQSGSLDLGLGGLCAVAYDHPSDTLYVIQCSLESVIYRFDAAGQPKVPATIPFSFGSTNDVDLDVISTPATVFGQAVPAGSLLLFDGETTATSVGVAWDRSANQIVELSWDTDMISRLNPVDASSITAFPVVPPASPDVFDVFFGDVEVGCDGDLFVVSSSNSAILRLDGDGQRLQTFYVPAGVGETDPSPNAGIAFDDATGRAFIAQNNDGTVVIVDGLDPGTC